jgi:hypothetical protein
MLNCLPTTTIQAVCPHLALFGSVPSYEHLRVFGCTCYTVVVRATLTQLSPRNISSPHVPPGVSFWATRPTTKAITALISRQTACVSRHVIFGEDNFPLAALSSLPDLDFLCESGPTVSTIGTHLTTAGTSTPAPRRPAPEIPSGFEPPWLPYPPWQFLQDSCPGRLPRLHHARPQLRHLPSQTARHPVHGRPH